MIVAARPGVALFHAAYTSHHRLHTRSLLCHSHSRTVQSRTVMACPATEVARFKAVSKLRSDFEAVVASWLTAETRNAGRRQRTLSKAFETWLFSRRAEALFGVDADAVSAAPTGYQDPIIPGGDAVAHDEDLGRKLAAAGATDTEVEAAMRAIAVAAKKAVASVASAIEAGSSTVPPGHACHGCSGTGGAGASGSGPQGCRAASDVAVAAAAPPFVVLRHGGVEAKCSHAHVLKLWTLWSHTKRDGAKSKKHGKGGGQGIAVASVATGGSTDAVTLLGNDVAFRAAVYCVLVRYLSAQGANLRGGRMQVSWWRLVHAHLHLCCTAAPPC